jgi:peptidoglycan/xylan/chitin deacetylase (PgdA/CDA1 family)
LRSLPVVAGARIGRIGGSLVRLVDRVTPAPTGIVLLAYHRVGGTTGVSVDLPTALVADHLDWLAEHADVVSLDTAADRLSINEPTTAERLVVLTADDGTADWVELLLPLLVERRLPMTWYVATRFVDEQVPFPDDGRPVSWAGLAEALSTGLVTVGSHTHSHAVMASLGATEAAAELDRSVGLIEDRLGGPCRHFAYPKAIAPSDAADAEVRRRFRTAALAANRVNVVGRTDPARLGRTPVQRGDGVGALGRKAQGGGRVEGWARERFDRRRHRGAVS